MGLEIKFNPEINFTACVGIKRENGKEGNEKINKLREKNLRKNSLEVIQWISNAYVFYFLPFLRVGLG